MNNRYYSEEEIKSAAAMYDYGDFEYGPSSTMPPEPSLEADSTNQTSAMVPAPPPLSSAPPMSPARVARKQRRNGAIHSILLKSAVMASMNFDNLDLDDTNTSVGGSVMSSGNNLNYRNRQGSICESVASNGSGLVPINEGDNDSDPGRSKSAGLTTAPSSPPQTITSPRKRRRRFSCKTKRTRGGEPSGDEMDEMTAFLIEHTKDMFGSRIMSISLTDDPAITPVSSIAKPRAITSSRVTQASPTDVITRHDSDHASSTLSSWNGGAPPLDDNYSDEESEFDDDNDASHYEAEDAKFCAVRRVSRRTSNCDCPYQDDGKEEEDCRRDKSFHDSSSCLPAPPRCFPVASSFAIQANHEITTTDGHP